MIQAFPPQRRQSRHTVWRALAGMALLGLCCTGCVQMQYYVQAARGQMSLLSDAKPVDQWLSDPSVDDQLKLRLSRAKQIRQFAVTELGLPDNASYKNYANIHRPFVLWNVVATPELSLTPKQWCFPIAGCVSYRGYYGKEDAQVFAAALREEGDDVQVAGVPAYSTLGWFNDPLMSTFIHYPDGELARLIFHELAHQVVYAKGDSQFNESFATAVEEAGVERWLQARGDAAMRAQYALFEGRKHDFLALLLKHQAALKDNYARAVGDQQKRQQKARIFQALQDDYHVLKEKWGGYAGYDRWFAEPLTNAHLASVATYNDLVPGFRVLLTQEKSFPQFYRAVTALAAQDQDRRHRQLLQLARVTPGTPVPDVTQSFDHHDSTTIQK